MPRTIIAVDAGPDHGVDVLGGAGRSSETSARNSVVAAGNTPRQLTVMGPPDRQRVDFGYNRNDSPRSSPARRPAAATPSGRAPCPGDLATMRFVPVTWSCWRSRRPAGRRPGEGASRPEALAFYEKRSAADPQGELLQVPRDGKAKGNFSLDHPCGHPEGRRQRAGRQPGQARR